VFGKNLSSLKKENNALLANLCIEFWDLLLDKSDLYLQHKSVMDAWNKIKNAVNGVIKFYSSMAWKANLWHVTILLWCSSFDLTEKIKKSLEAIKNSSKWSWVCQAKGSSNNLVLDYSHLQYDPLLTEFNECCELSWNDYDYDVMTETTCQCWRRADEVIR